MLVIVKMTMVCKDLDCPKIKVMMRILVKMSSVAPVASVVCCKGATELMCSMGNNNPFEKETGRIP